MKSATTLPRPAQHPSSPVPLKIENASVNTTAFSSGLVGPALEFRAGLQTDSCQPIDEARLSGRQPDWHDTMLQVPEPLPNQGANQPGPHQEREKPQRQPGQEAVRLQEGLGLFPLMFLDRDDLRHPLRHDLPGGDVNVSRGGAACEDRAQVVGAD